MEVSRTPSPQQSAPLSSTPLVTPKNPPPKATSKSCLPRPLFQDEPETFSTKKEKRRVGGLFKPPPRPPAKSCPPKSRVFPQRNLLKAQAVCFNDTADRLKVIGTPLQSAVYDTKKNQSYFQQAFISEAKIGSGYFGSVYRVRSKEDDKVYAVKIAREIYKGPTDRARKLEEARKHQFLPPHSNLVRFYHSWEENGRLYQQFELCKGNLEEKGQQGKLSEDIIWDYLVDLLQAVNHLHDHNLVHMDIKPENIFIGMDGICKLGDFGLVIDFAQTDGEDGMEGDPCYLAPEVLNGTFTKACDIFSLGVSILELATDMELPKSGQLWHDLRNKGPDPSLTMHMQPELRRVVQLMMTRDSERRPSVKQLLDLPCIVKAVKRRERRLLLNRGKELMIQIAMAFAPLWTFLSAFLLSIVIPLKQAALRYSSIPSTPPPYAVAAAKFGLSDCFSDDEMDCTASSACSSLAAPLHSSDSSDNSILQELSPANSRLKSKYYSPEEFSHMSSFSKDSPLKRPMTSPGPRCRGRFLPRTPGSAGVSPGKKLFFDTYDVESVSRNDSPELLSGSKLAEEDDSDVEFVTMKPHSLAATFDFYSDED